MSGWYKVSTPSGVFFTPYASRKTNYLVIGDGVADPTPKELAEVLEEDPNSYLHESGKLVVKPYNNETDMEAIELSGGSYIFREASGSSPDRLVPLELRADGCTALGTTFSNVQNDISNFLDSEKVYRDLGVIYKLGILLYGSQGNGKTTLIRKILKELVPKEAIIILIDKEFPDDEFLITVKNTLGDRLKVFVFEELALDLSDWFVGRLLSFLDGELSIDNSISFATTNYPEKLPMNIVDRPSRFDKLYEFEMPTKEERAELFRYFLGYAVQDQDLELSKDLSIASIKEASLLVLINKMSLSDAIKTMKRRSVLCSKAFAKSRATIGFGGDF